MSFLIGMAILAGIIALAFGISAFLRAIPAGAIGAVAGRAPMIGTIVGGILGMGVLIALMATSTFPWQTWVAIMGAGVIAFAFRTSTPGRWAAGILLFLGVVYASFHGIYGDKAAEVAKENQKALAAAATSSAPTITPTVQGSTSEQTATVQGATTKVATWDNWKQGDPLPVGVVSKEFEIPVGCSTRYMGGFGTHYMVEYRFYSPKWDLHPGGDASPPASHVRFTILEGGRGMTTFPIRVTCVR